MSYHAPEPVGSEPDLLDIDGERCARILQLLNEAWERASECQEVNPASGEVEITESLRDSLRDVINGQVVEWGNKVWVLPGTESRSRLGARRPAGITDIPIAFTDIREAHGDHDPHAIIECKRIAGSRADLCRLYVVEGIDRFKTAKYAGKHVFGFMAGYILSGDPPSATHGINRYLTKKGRQDERLRPCLIRAEPWTRSSVHHRPRLNVPITLHHAFLSFDLHHREADLDNRC